MKLLLFVILLVVCWPAALLLVLLYPLVWLLLLPFRLVGLVVHGVFELVSAIFMFPAGFCAPFRLAPGIALPLR